MKGYYTRIRAFISILFFLVILSILFPLAGCSQTQKADEQVFSSGEDRLAVHFIDVGQGDAIFVRTPSGSTMLIDAGGNEQGKKMVSYLKKIGIKRIDVLVGTHPHEDHIGGLDVVIGSFDIGQIYMPKVTHTTKAYKDVLAAVKRKGLKIKTGKEGVVLPLDGVKARILAPVDGFEPENLNDYSIVIRVVYKDTAFIFQGDAQESSEKAILGSGQDVQADVMKIGHHGSRDSSCREYIEAVNPRYAVICVGRDNDYGHPHKKTMQLLKEKRITVYRTDECGTVVATSDGENISFNKKPCSYSYRDK